MMFVGRLCPPTTSKINTVLNEWKYYSVTRMPLSSPRVMFRILGQDDPRLCHQCYENENSHNTLSE